MKDKKVKAAGGRGKQRVKPAKTIKVVKPVARKS